jgi:hypothetical protein
MGTRPSRWIRLVVHQQQAARNLHPSALSLSTRAASDRRSTFDLFLPPEVIMATFTCLPVKGVPTAAAVTLMVALFAARTIRSMKTMTSQTCQTNQPNLLPARPTRDPPKTPVGGERKCEPETADGGPLALFSTKHVLERDGIFQTCGPTASAIQSKDSTQLRHSHHGDDGTIYSYNDWSNGIAIIP